MHENGPNRRSIRLRAYDYGSTGAYFLTLSTIDRAMLFGSIEGGEMRLSAIGMIVAAAWEESPRLRPTVALDCFVVMPNHLHGIVIIEGGDPARADMQQGLHSTRRTIGALVRGFKGTTTRQAGTPLWQRNYYEHVIRDNRDLERIRRYIADNPANWDHDGENPLLSPLR